MKLRHPIQRTELRGDAARRTGRGAIVLAAMILTVSGCAAPAEEVPASTGDSAILTEHELDGLDARTLIERLDMMAVSDRPTDLMASIRPDAIQLSDDEGRQTSVPLPEDEFYVSVAPYVEHTHDCYFHSLTTCHGELQNRVVQVTVTDTATGVVLLNDMLRTYDNGFLGFWLPRDIHASITIGYEGRSASAPVSTGREDPTCLTTLRLI